VLKYDTKVADAFARAVQEIKPDMVHSFALYTSCLPILEVMNDNRNVKWMYSSWGSDLFYKANKPNYDKEVSSTLERVDYLITDCLRDAGIASQMGFKGKHLGVFPGGGGFETRDFKKIRKKNSFVVKGYENELGKAIPVMKALFEISKKIPINVSVFGATQRLLHFIETHKYEEMTLKCYQKLSHAEVIELMEESIFYIGNSISDGVPNTLLEAIYSGCVPIQSNPGNATGEIIEHAGNGYLINEPENEKLIEHLIKDALSSSRNLNYFYENNASIRNRFEREKIKVKVLIMYQYLNS
jgi:glycosyltransferase involved in cell wall biosynthesis